MLNQFKNFNEDGLQLDDLVALAAFGRMFRAECEEHQLEEPEYVDVQLKKLRREITLRSTEKLEARRKEVESRLDSLKTPTERRAELLKEKAELDKKLKEVGVGA